MPWTPRGGKALSRAASGRVPGPSTTYSWVKGIMLLIIFLTALMVASFEHSLLREQRRLADGSVVEIPNVATVRELERFVETEARVALRGAAAAAHKIGLDRDVAYAAHLAKPVLEHAGAFLEAPVEELGRDYQLVADALRVLARPGAEPDALEAKAAELADLEAERAVRAAQAELKAAAAAKEKAEAERYEAERAKRIADAEKRIAAKREAQEAAAAERLAAEKARAERAAEEKDVATKRKKQEADLARAKAEIESVAAEAQARADADRKAADTVLYAIVTPSIVREKINTGNDRQKLVQASLKAWPALRRFNASYQLDSSCVSILQRRHITISTKYYSEERGVGWIHAGKVGHWCSFLRYLVYCNTSDAVVCVWIEDDFKLSAKNIQTIETQASKMAKTRDNKYAVTSLGLGDEVNIIDSRLLHLLLDRFHHFEITQPLDITLRAQTRLGRANRVFGRSDRIFVGKETSTLVCSTCALLRVQTVNKLINKTVH